MSLIANPVTKWGSITLGALVFGMLIGMFGTLYFLTLVGLVIFLWASVRWPVAVLCSIVFAQIVLPMYVLIPLPGLPSIPAALFMLMAFSVVVFAGVLLNPASRNPPDPGNVRFLVLYAVFAGVMLISLLDADSTKDSFNLWIRAIAIPLVVYLVVYRVCRSAENIFSVFNWVTLAGVVAALFAAVEFLLGRNILIEKLMLNDPNVDITITYFYTAAQELGTTIVYRCFSFFMNPIEFGTFMAMVFPYPLLRAISAPRPLQKKLWMLGTLVCFAGTLLSLSRGPILALLLVTLVLSVLVKPLRRIIVNTLVVIFVCGVAAWPIIGEKVMVRAKEADNVTLRIKLWQAGWHMFADNPLIGVGLGNYRYHQADTIREHQIGPFDEYDGDIDKISAVDNAYLQLAAETGVLGLAAFAVTLLAFFVAVWRVVRHYPHHAERDLALAAGGATLVYLLSGVTATAYTLYVVTLLLGLYFASVFVLERSLASAERTA